MKCQLLNYYRLILSKSQLSTVVQLNHNVLVNNIRPLFIKFSDEVELEY